MKPSLYNRVLISFFTLLFIIISFLYFGLSPTMATCAELEAIEKMITVGTFLRKGSRIATSPSVGIFPTTIDIMTLSQLATPFP